MMRFVVLAFFVGLFFTGCMKTDKTVCELNPCSIKAPVSESEAVKAYLDSVGITTATKHCSGLYYEIINAGSSEKPQDQCNMITVKYEGRLVNGMVFDSNETGVVLMVGRLIDGWRNSISMIGRGGKMKLYIPPSLGYGTSGMGTVPGGAILIFDIELLTFE